MAHSAKIFLDWNSFDLMLFFFFAITFFFHNRKKWHEMHEGRDSDNEPLLLPTFNKCPGRNVWRAKCFLRRKCVSYDFAMGWMAGAVFFFFLLASTLDVLQFEQFNMAAFGRNVMSSVHRVHLKFAWFIVWFIEIRRNILMRKTWLERFLQRQLNECMKCAPKK